jgi:hypothetical protein
MGKMNVVISNMKYTSSGTVPVMQIDVESGLVCRKCALNCGFKKDIDCYWSVF